MSLWYEHGPGICRFLGKKFCSGLGKEVPGSGECYKIKYFDNREVLQNEFRYNFRKGPREISAGTVITVLKAC